jgi:hypothetical protein
MDHTPDVLIRTRAHTDNCLDAVGRGCSKKRLGECASAIRLERLTADRRNRNSQTDALQIATLEKQMAIFMASLEDVRTARDGWKEIAARYGCPMADDDPVQH